MSGSPPSLALTRAEQVLALQQAAGNRAVRAQLLQRDPAGPPPPGGQTLPAGQAPPARQAKSASGVHTAAAADTKPGTMREWDPVQWARMVADIAAKHAGDDQIKDIVMAASNSVYAADREGGSIQLADKMDPWVMLLDVAHDRWRDDDWFIELASGPATRSWWA